MFPIDPNVASVLVVIFGLRANQYAWFEPKDALFAESNVAVALVNMFMRRLVPLTNCKAPVGGVKLEVYNAVPFTIRTFAMKPV